VSKRPSSPRSEKKAPKRDSGPSPFDFLNAINETKRDLLAEGVPDLAYNAFMVNRGLSYFLDTVLDASEMDRMAHIPRHAAFRYLLHSVTRRRRFSKWARAGKSIDIDAISDFYKYGRRGSAEALRILSADQVAELRRLTGRE